MGQALREAFSDARGKISRRAIGFYILLLLFCLDIFMNLFYKRYLSADTENHLFEAMMLVLGSIFGDGLVNRQKSSATPPPA